MLLRYILAITCVLLGAMESAADPYEYELKKVEPKFISDGDTVSVSIRLYGIDTPESDQLCERADGSCWRCGERAQEVLSGFVKNQETRLQFTGDVTHGRPVATIRLGQRDINKEMVRQGHAVVFERFLPSDMKREYNDAQNEAKNGNRGVWQGDFIMPWDWRAGDRLSCE